MRSTIVRRSLRTLSTCHWTCWSNDFPSSTDTLNDRGGHATGPCHGTISPDGQELFITPDRGAFSPPNELFTYTIDDGTGKQDTANVTVFILPGHRRPVAVDDTFRVGDVTNQSLDVMANDLPGVAGVIDLLSFDRSRATARIPSRQRNTRRSVGRQDRLHAGRSRVRPASTSSITRSQCGRQRARLQ